MPGGTGGGAKHWRKAKYLAIQGADAFYYANAAVNLKRPPGYDYRKSANKVKIDHKGKVFTYVLSGMVRFLASWIVLYIFLKKSLIKGKKHILIYLGFYSTSTWYSNWTNRSQYSSICERFQS